MSPWTMAEDDAIRLRSVGLILGEAWDLVSKVVSTPTGVISGYNIS